MPNVVAIGTYLPCWGTPLHRAVGDDEDAITMAVEAGRAALRSGASVERVVLVSRDLPLLESSNAAVLLAGLGLDPELEVHDFFTGIELISYEDLGFVDRFGGHKLVEAEVTTVGGALPVNQVDGARVGLAHNIGGPTAVSAVTILEGPGADGS